MKDYVNSAALQEYTTKLVAKLKTLFPGTPTAAATVAEMTDHNKTYVYVGTESGYTAGDWYYWNGTAWTSGGPFQATSIITDTTLAVAGEAADAKATGDAIAAAKTAVLNAMAPAYSTSGTYAVGDYVNHNGAIYRCTTAITTGEAWTAGHWAAVTLGADLEDQVGALKESIIPVNFDNVTLLTEGADLFQLTVGVYYTNASTLSNTIVNKPDGISGNFRIIVYNISATNRRGIMIWTTSAQIWFTSEGPNGYYVWKRIATYDVIDSSITTAVSAVENEITIINNNIVSTYNENEARFNFEDAQKKRTVNLLNPDTLTSGYILVNNVPTARENYYYSDYIKIGNMPFCYRDQGASIGYLISCYDEEKNYLGAVDYSSETGYERISGGTPTGYYKITPLNGTVYIRVNGRYTSNLMLCPYFYPEKYIKYNEIYNKGTLKIAMFGDSITYGTNGNDHSTPATENLPYWVEKITGYLVDNYGVGSMGWVSTQYLSDIAYNKISTIDLSSYDIVTLCFGVNDTGAVLGTFDDTDESTIMGQVNKCVKYIGAQNPKARIIIIAPWNGASSNASFPKWGYGRLVYYAANGDTSRTKTRTDLGNAEKELCGLYGIGYISQEDSPLNGFGLGSADGTTPGPYIGTDLVHPSLDGYKAMGEWLSAKITGIVKYK